MDFFEAQDRARSRSKFLVVYFLAAVASIIAVIYVVTVVVLGQVEQQRSPDLEAVPLLWWQPQVFAAVAAVTLAVILLGSFFKSLTLRAGGGVVARSVGAVRVESDTTNPGERRLLNVVEEMAIASGVRVPEVYLLPEPAINAFAAGHSPDDAAIAVTQGALNTLTRDELQGVIAHEFSHIFNGDMRLNVRLIGLLFGILLLAIIGRVAIQSLRFSGGGRSRGKNSGGIIAAIFVLGLTLLIVGYIGVLFGRLIQAAVSRQREFLADASAVQFTRNPAGLGGALRKIGGLAGGARIQNAHATETAHMFFANALSPSFTSLFATHPPLVERIRAIDPNFDGKFPMVTSSEAPFAVERAARRSAPATIRPDQFITAIATAAIATQPETGAAVIASIPGPLLAAAHEPARARAVVLALLADPRDAGAGRRQSLVLGQTLTSQEMQTGAETVPLIAQLPPESRLALLDLTLPTLRAQPQESIAELLAAIDEMVLADYQVTPFEFAIQHLVRRNLRAAGRTPAVLNAPPATPQAQSADVAAVLGTIARAGSPEPAAAAAAYAAGARFFGLADDQLGDRDEGATALTRLATVLQRLDRVPGAQKKRVLEALAVTASKDGSIAPDELALLRAFAAALDCPAPIMSAA
jgi:Zn-dependent protease with chaperone function